MKCYVGRLAIPLQYGRLVTFYLQLHSIFLKLV